MTNLVDAIVGIHDGLDSAGLPHAFGGALALAWCTGEPRATRDVDVNVFVAPDHATRVLDALPAGVAWTAADAAQLFGDGQHRVRWGRIPIDIFLSNTSFHDEVADRVVGHPFAGRTLPFLSCADLAVFKAFFDRPRDWVDLAEIAACGRLQGDQVVGVLVRLLGSEDPRVDRLVELLDAASG